MASHNMHYLYNVEYFEPLYSFRGDISELSNNSNLSDQFGNLNCEINDFEYEEVYDYADNLSEKLKSAEPGAGFKYKEFELYTSYPGLLLGTGYEHDISAKEGITCGFSFDYVTGLPVIPGSTLKGMLRSCFPEKGKADGQEKNNLIESVIKTVTNDDNFQSENISYEKLVDDIFEEDGETDIFIGAYPIPGRGQRILKKEYITPHKNPIKNPIPIMLLKVRPNVKYRFMFMLKDSVRDSGDIVLSADKKAELFRELILIEGIGAKTNVGFGRFAMIQNNNA